MQALLHRGEQSSVSLGQRRGIPDLAGFALDLTRVRVETECPAGTRAYPSPPMSGSPPLPPKPNQEAGDRGQGSFQAGGHDAYRSAPAYQGQDIRRHSGAPPSQPSLPPPSMARGARPYQQESAEQLAYPYRRSEDAMGRPMSYPPQPLGQSNFQPQYSLPPVSGALSGSSSYALPARPQAAENPAFTSPKSQRKTKGHVASACVPCKRAHLRCDAQRPCSRCLSNGKEDACVDVQHKKRGRPRLRDDREPRFDNPRFSHPADPNIRRPVSLYSPASMPAAPYDDPLRRTQSYRVLKSQPSDPVVPRYLERGSTGEANIYPPPLSIATRSLEPVAFLTVDLEIARASTTFVDAVGAGTAQNLQGRKLLELINPSERDRVGALQRSLQDEQGRKEPNYLPPIFGREEADRVIQSLPFDAASISRFSLERQDFFTFVSPEGQSRPYPIRIGLAKEESIYFVVLALNPSTRAYSHPSPSQHTSYSYQPQPLAQLNPSSTSFEASRHRSGDARDWDSFMSRQPPTPSGTAGLSPGVSPNLASYSASSNMRPEHPSGSSYHIPRSELPAPRPTPPAYQLPPIRSHTQPGPSADPRAGRLDIGGLIDKPDHTHRGGM